MSCKGNYYDNAMAETVIKTIKSEMEWCTVFQTRTIAEKILGRYIDGFYNPIRQHSLVGYKSPIEFETIAVCTELKPLH